MNKAVVRTEKTYLSPLAVAALVICLVIVSDQFTKFLVRKTMHPGEHRSFLGGFIQFIHVENHGGFLGVLSQTGEETRYFLLTIGVSLLLAAGFFYLLFRARKLWLVIYLAMVMGGGLSNLLDRFFLHGGVTDFILLQLFSMHTGIFNLADVYILSGSCLLGYTYFSRT